MAATPETDSRPPWWQLVVPTVWPAWPSGDSEAGGRLADGVLFVFAVALGGITQAYLWHTHGPVLDWLDVAFGVVACLALWWRRAHPAAVFVLSLGAAFSPLALFAFLVAICTMAARARGRVLVAVVLLAVAGSFVWPAVNPAAGEIVRLGFPGFLFTVMAFGWGLYLRARRDLVASLQERADRLEADQRRSAEQARDAERRRIAREMHDVLAHRLSLLSVHAGALEFHPGAPADEIAQAAAVIRTSAAAALGDLRQVITVLREDSVAADGPPQPGFGQLEELLEESRSAGMTLDARIDIAGPGQLPETLGRTVYRVIQEGLTNARRHAPGAPVEVTVGAQDGSVTAEVVSRRTSATPGMGTEAPAGAGAGLIGLAERVGLAGGRLEHGLNAMGDFVLRATLPRQP
jgi:signal transduction histidine kinase